MSQDRRPRGWGAAPSASRSGLTVKHTPLTGVAGVGFAVAQVVDTGTQASAHCNLRPPASRAAYQLCVAIYVKRGSSSDSPSSIPKAAISQRARFCATGVRVSRLSPQSSLPTRSRRCPTWEKRRLRSRIPSIAWLGNPSSPNRDISRMVCSCVVSSRRDLPRAAFFSKPGS
jgi:hypothetical protein